MAMKEIDILLLGRTGNGKSALGNSILNKPAFETSGSLESVTRKFDLESSEYKTYDIQVVDTQGYGDTRLKSAKYVEEFSKCITQAMKANDGRGFHAFLHVMKYGNRLTDDERDAFNTVNRIFPGVMSSHGILLMTGGDTFKRDHKKSGKTFEEWCQDQGKSFQELLSQFGGRVLIFNNHSDSKEEMEAQLDRLLQVVESLPAGGERYTDILFMASLAELRDSFTENNEDFIKSSLMRSTSAFLDHYDKCERLEAEHETNASIREMQLTEWRLLQSRCDKLIECAEYQEGGEKANIMEKIVSMRLTIVEHIKVKENNNEGKEDKFPKMQAAKDSLAEKYKTMKRRKIALIVGGTVLCAVALSLAGIITLLIRNPQPLLVVFRLSRLLWAFLVKSKPLIVMTTLCSIVSQVVSIVKKKETLKIE